MENDNEQQTNTTEPDESLSAFETMRQSYETQLLELKNSYENKLKEKDNIMKHIILNRTETQTDNRTRAEIINEYVRKLRGN